MNYLFKEGSKAGNYFILLHGTGGDEYSLLEIANYLDEEATILSFKGNIQEDGMNRFFKRNGLNQFDIESLEEETDELLQAIIKISDEKKIPLEKWTLLGYSNGANIIGHLFLERETLLDKAILFHPMFLGVETKTFSLADKNVWLSVGETDPIVSTASFQKLHQLFSLRGAKVSVFSMMQGHQLSMDELEQAKKWLEKKA